MQRKQFVTRGETPTLQQLPHSVHVSLCPEVLRTVISHLGYGPLCFSTTFLASDLMSNCSFFFTSVTVQLCSDTVLTAFVLFSSLGTQMLQLTLLNSFHASALQAPLS